MLTALAGCLLHGLYALWPNAFTALASPIWESLWEHLKNFGLAPIWPPLWSSPGTAPQEFGPWLLSLLLMCAGMLGAGYLYHIVLGGESFWPDLVLYLLLLLFGFWFPRRFSGPFEGVRWKLPLAGGGGPPAADGPVYPVAPGPPAVCGPVRGGHLEPAALLTSFLSPRLWYTDYTNG